jgi:hypothetical protein
MPAQAKLFRSGNESESLPHHSHASLAWTSSAFAHLVRIALS